MDTLLYPYDSPPNFIFILTRQIYKINVSSPTNLLVGTCRIPWRVGLGRLPFSAFLLWSRAVNKYLHVIGFDRVVIIVLLKATRFGHILVWAKYNINIFNY
jgi:hypothetical protein